MRINHNNVCSISRTHNFLAFKCKFKKIWWGLSICESNFGVLSTHYNYLIERNFSVIVKYMGIGIVGYHQCSYFYIYFLVLKGTAIKEVKDSKCCGMRTMADYGHFLSSSFTNIDFVFENKIKHGHLQLICCLTDPC